MASCLALLAPRLACGAEAAPGSTSGGDDPCSIRESLRRTRPDPEGPPVRIEVGLFLVDVIEINEVLESFKVDIRLQLQWQDSRLSAKARGGSLEECRLRLADIWHPEVDLINQRTVRTDQERDVDVAADGQVRFSERIFAELGSPLDLDDFPFDRQRLRIQLASLEYGPEDVVLTVDEENSGRREDILLAGWEILETFSEPHLAAASPHTRLDQTILVARQARYHIWTVIVPLCLIALMAWSVFWLDPAHFAPQIGVATASIFTLIAFRLGLAQLLPRVSYLTRADELVLGITALVFVALGEVVLTSRLAQGGRAELARRIDGYGRWIYLLLFGSILWVTLTG